MEPPKEAPKTSSSRLPLLVAAIVIVVVGLAIFGFERLFGQAERAELPPPPPPAPTRVAPEKEEAVVVAVEGKVERMGQGGAWQPLAAGERLVSDDSLRTGPGGRADLQISKAKMTVTDSSELAVRELTSAVHRFQLSQGRITAAYDQAGERVVRIEGPKGGAVAEAKGARFNVLSTQQALAVATQTGTVNLAAAGKAVAIGSGQQAVAQAGQAPSAAEPLPADILLKIAKARASSDASRCLVIDGEASPGSEVTVDGVQVALEANGKFHYDAPRARGQKFALVLTRDVSGRVREQSLKCKELPKAEPEPEIKVKMQWKTGGG